MTTSNHLTGATETIVLTALHDHYSEAVNIAVAEDDYVRVASLSAAYELELDETRRSLALRAA